MTKIMLKKKEILVYVILLILMSSLGCLEKTEKLVTDPIKKVNLNFPSNTLTLGKDKISSTISYKSTYQNTYQDTQTVIITLRASEHIGLSKDESGEFKQSISWTEEIARGHEYSKNFYISIIDSSTPPGKYTIYGSIKGEKSNDTSNDTMELDHN